MLATLVLGLPAYVLIKILSPGFYARRDVRTPVIIAVVTLVLGVLANFILVPRLGIVALPLSTAGAAWANALTLAAFCLSLVVGLLLTVFPAARPLYLLVPVTLFVRMALNAADGMLAREYNLKTPLGALLNELTDPLSDAALYLPFALVTGSPLVAIWIGLRMIELILKFRLRTPRRMLRPSRLTIDRGDDA